MEIQRWKFWTPRKIVSCGCQLYTDPSGEWVKYIDILPLLAALQIAERGRPGESVSPIPPELEHNGERTDCLVVGPRPPSAASPQQVAAEKQGNE